MSQPAPREALQQRVAATIRAAAAAVLAARGEQASMHDVAVAAGVARATVYRYFPSRQALLDDVARLALDDAGARLESARIDEVSWEEGVRRTIRALVEVGDPIIVLARERVHPDADQLEVRLAAPLRRLVDRGQTLGAMRADIPAPWLAQSLVGLVVSVLSTAPARGREDTIAAIADLFLDGARARKETAHG